MIQKKERKEGRVKEGKEKKREKKHKEKRSGQWPGYLKTETPHFNEKVLPHFNVSTET